MNQLGRDRFFLVGACLALVLPTGALAAWVLLGDVECTGYCLTDDDIEFVDQLEADPFLATGPTGAPTDTPSLSTACDPSGGWFGALHRDTRGPVEDTVSRYDELAVQHGWQRVEVAPSVPAEALATYRRDDGTDSVTVTLLPLGSTSDPSTGVKLAVHSPRLSASCSTTRP